MLSLQVSHGVNDPFTVAMQVARFSEVKLYYLAKL